MKDQPSIVFFGTPEFAVPTLHALHRSAFDLQLVTTQPDRQKGRGRRLAPPPVKQTALEMGYDIAQPTDVRDETFISRLKAIDPEFLVVVAFGQILPSTLLKIPRRGAINVHASLLPKYRGPAPIQWAIMRGEKNTGITTMLMDQGVDTGDMLLKKDTSIKTDDTAATLHDRLARMGAELIVPTLEGLFEGTLFPRSQNHALATYAPMLKKDNGRIDWQQPVETIDAQIRAMTPWPGAFCTMGNKRFKIHKAHPLPNEHQAIPGTVVPGFPDELRVATGKGILSILEIQGASGKRMAIKTFLNGHPILPDAVFS